MDDLVLAMVIYLIFLILGMAFLVKGNFVAAYVFGVLAGFFGRILWCEYKKFMEK